MNQVEYEVWNYNHIVPICMYSSDLPAIDGIRVMPSFTSRDVYVMLIVPFPSSSGLGSFPNLVLSYVGFLSEVHLGKYL